MRSALLEGSELSYYEKQSNDARLADAREKGSQTRQGPNEPTKGVPQTPLVLRLDV